MTYQQGDKFFDDQGLLAVGLRCAANKRWTPYSVASGCGKVRAQRCQTGAKICGLQTRIMLHNAHEGDNKGVIDVKFSCCPPHIGAFL